MLLLARITSAVEAGAVAGRLEPAPQPATVSAAAVTAMIAAVRFCPMLVKTAARHGKFPAGRLAHKPSAYPQRAAHAEALRMADKRLRRSRRDESPGATLPGQSSSAPAIVSSSAVSCFAERPASRSS